MGDKSDVEKSIKAAGTESSTVTTSVKANKDTVSAVEVKKKKLKKKHVKKGPFNLSKFLLRKRVIIPGIVLLLLIAALVYFLVQGFPWQNDADDPVTTAEPQKQRFSPVSSLPRASKFTMSEPTFEIVSAKWLLNLTDMDQSLSYTMVHVDFVLNITKKTEMLKLRCDVDLQMISVGSDTMDSEKANKMIDKTNQVLTIPLKQPVATGTLNLGISYIPSDEAFDRYRVPCAGKNCSVYINRALRYLIPHFDDMTKHVWHIDVIHSVKFKVLMNSNFGAGDADESLVTTKPLLPSEFSFAIVESLDQQHYGGQVETHLLSDTIVPEKIQLAQFLSEAITSVRHLSKEMFRMVIVPSVDNYKFFGRNLAIVGENMLWSNDEIKLNFVWTWVFRTLIYDKVTSSDKNPTWIYDASAFFLSTSLKSNNPEIWRKHLYEVAMELDHNGVKGSSMQSMKYQDEYRYYEQLQNVAKISTLLQMLTSFGRRISGDPLPILQSARSSTTSGKFFFLNKDIQSKNGPKIPVDSFMSSCFDSPDLPRVDISRNSPSQVVVQRSNVDQRCEIFLSIQLEEKSREFKYLEADVKKIEIASKSPVLLTGEDPFSANAYSMDQAEFDKLLEYNVLDSYEKPSLNLLASNAVRAAGEGRLSYDSLKRLMDKLLQRKAVSVDEAVDLWTSVIGLSRKETFKSLTIPVIKSSMEVAGRSFEYMDMSNYAVVRFYKSLQESPLFMIQKATMLVKNCGDSCFQLIADKYAADMTCVTQSATGCSSDPHTMEIYACSKVATGDKEDYEDFESLYGRCKDKSCYLPVLRGLLCTRDRGNLEKLLNGTMELNTTDMVSRQVVQIVVDGLASNDVSRPLLLPYLLDNWPSIYMKFHKTPSLLGNIVNALTSGINTEADLQEYKDFLSFYSETVAIAREFQDQAIKAEKAVKWNKNLSKKFERLFQ